MVPPLGNFGFQVFAFWVSTEKSQYQSTIQNLNSKSVLVFSFLYYYRNVTRPLEDGGCHTTRARAKALDGRPFVRVDGLDKEVFRSHLVIVFGVGCGAAHHLQHLRCAAMRQEPQDS